MNKQNQKVFGSKWGAKDVLIVTISVLALGALAIFLFKFFGEDSLRLNASGFLLAYVIQGLFFLIPMWIYLRKKYGKIKFSDFGFTKKWSIKGILPAIAGYLVYVFAIFLIGLAIVVWDVKIPGFQPEEVSLPVEIGSNLTIILTAITVTILAPFVEEIFFRGFILQGLMKRIGKYWAAIVSAGLFSVLHLQLGNIIPLFIIGLILSALFIQTKSIWPSIWLHFMVNSIAFTFQLLLLFEVIKLDF